MRPNPGHTAKVPAIITQTSSIVSAAVAPRIFIRRLRKPTSRRRSCTWPMPRIVWAVRCASILRRSRSLAMRKQAVSCAVATARLMLCRKRFDHRRRPRLTMRILIGGATLFLVIVAVFLTSFVFAGPRSSDRISVTVNEQARRVDISIDGQPFTSYIWPTTLKKPVLYPLRTAKGTIVHRSIVSSRSGPEQGELDVESDWVTFDKKVLLQEHTHFVFRGGPGFRSVDRITTLRALDTKVDFKDEKDGVLGLRVVRALEIPSDKPEVYTDASGRATTVAKLDNAGVNGTYLTSEGKKGDAAWGTRGRWCNLSGLVGGEPVTISMLDHSANPGFPTYWHARGYGLFAANPLGQKIFSNGKEELNFSLAPHASATFRYRILISSAIATPEATEAAYKDFVATYH